jgi:hypothetical protein
VEVLTSGHVLSTGQMADPVLSRWTANATLYQVSSSKTTAATLDHLSVLGLSSNYRLESNAYGFSEGDCKTMMPFLTFVAEVLGQAFGVTRLDVPWDITHHPLYNAAFSAPREHLQKADWVLMPRVKVFGTDRFDPANWRLSVSRPRL